MCEILTEDTKELLKCINCGKNGHTASYLGCKYLSMSQDLKQQAFDMKKSIKTNKIHRLINPNTSYADLTSNYNSSFPALPRNPLIGLTDDLRQQRTPNRPDNININTNNRTCHQQDNNFGAIEELFNRFRDNIMEQLTTQLNKMNERITENARKIEYLLTTNIE